MQKSERQMIVHGNDVSISIKELFNSKSKYTCCRCDKKKSEIVVIESNKKHFQVCSECLLKKIQK